MGLSLLNDIAQGLLSLCSSNAGCKRSKALNSVKNEDTPVGSTGVLADVATGITGSIDNVSAK